MLSDPARIPVSGAMGAARDVPYVTAQISVATANAQAVRFMMFSLVQGGGKRRALSALRGMPATGFALNQSVMEFPAM